MALRRPALVGVGQGSCAPPTGSADGCACWLGGTRAQGLCGGSLGGAGRCRRSATSAAWQRLL